MAKTIQDFVADCALPIEPDSILPAISNGEEYLSQEGETWDFKATWPSSYSDDYFGGIARLICSFYNTSGGLIIFGVDDATRKGGKNKINPNIDRLQQSIEQITGRIPYFEMRRYQSTKLGDVDILLVGRKPDNVTPIRFKRPVAKYQGKVIWIRRGSEVREATTRDVPLLYLRGATEDGPASPLGHLPPSPATVREFVGRMQTMDAVFEWIMKGDDPRAFLFGKGGSGKSTIAYEIFKHIRT